METARTEPTSLRRGWGGRFLLLRNTGIYTLGNVLPQAVNVLLLPVFTRYLSGDDYGILNYTTALSAFLFVLGSLSIHSYVLRHYFDCSSEDERARLFGSVFLFLLAVDLAVLAAAAAVLPVAFSLLGVQIPFHPYVLCALLVNFVEVLATLPMAYFRVRQQAGRFVAITIVRSLAATGLSLYLVVGLRMGVMGRYGGLLAEAAAALVFLLAVTVRISRFSWDRALVRRALAFCGPILPGALLLNVTAVSDRLILERFVPLREIGLYGLAATVAGGLGFVVTGIYRAVEPEIYRMAGEPRFAPRILALKRLLVAVLAGAAFLLIGFSREIVALLAGPDFEESRTVLPILALPFVLQGAAMPANCYFLAIRRTSRLPLVALAGAAASVAGNLALVPLLGIHGSAWAAVAASAATMLMYGALTDPAEVRWRFGPDLLAVAVIAGAGFGLSRVGWPSFWPTVAVKAALAAAGLAAIALVFQHTRRRLEALAA